MTPKSWGLLLTIMALVSSSAFGEELPKGEHCRVAKVGDAWRLLSDGKPFYIKGAVGWEHYDVLAECGGSAVRARATKADLDRACAVGLRVMAGLPVRGERDGMNWSDPEMVDRQKRQDLSIVEQLKDHPALMLWAVGNELDHIPGGRAYDPKLWERLDDLAVAIHKLDPNHPVLTVVGTGRFEQKIQQMARSCTDMDLLGINAYGDIEKVTELARQYWPKPYVVAEWGPTGHWQAPKTEWRAPLEQTGTEKARVILDRYTRIIQADREHCLGSFVFLWGQKQETTHTWYGMFQDGLRTESVDAMQFAWTGAWPANRTPAVLDLAIEGFFDPRRVYLEPSGTYRAKMRCKDPDGDRLTFQWDIRPEVEIPANSYAGRLEKRVAPLPGLIKGGSSQEVTITAPDKPGPYRLFARVLDGHGHVGYGNVPFFVKK